MAMSEETKRQYEREKQAYWQQRQELLMHYSGKWVAIVDGKVAGVADQMNRAAAEASRNVGRRVMYVNLVGNEDVVLRIRQLTMGHYDHAYTPASGRAINSCHHRLS
jgi:hypothetical protein